MRNPDEDILRRGMRALGEAVHGEDPWEEVARRRRRLTARRRRRNVTTGLVVTLALAAAGTLLFRAFFTDPGTTPGNRSTAAPTRGLDEQLDDNPGIALDQGDLGGEPWVLYLFDDPDDLLDGTGQNVYLLLGTSRYYLDRPDSGRAMDTLIGSSPDGREVLVIAVATAQVESVELTFEDGLEHAQSARPDQAAFDRVFWVSGAVPAGQFRGRLVARDAQGRVIDQRSASGHAAQ